MDAMQLPVNWLQNMALLAGPSIIPFTITSTMYLSTLILKIGTTEFDIDSEVVSLAWDIEPCKEIALSCCFFSCFDQKCYRIFKFSVEAHSYTVSSAVCSTAEAMCWRWCVNSVVVVQRAAARWAAWAAWRAGSTRRTWWWARGARPTTRCRDPPHTVTSLTTYSLLHPEGADEGIL